MTSLDALRGLACCVVVISHLYLLIPDDVRKGFAAFLWWKLLRPLHNGDLAVCIFFVLSGFVLSLPYARGTEQRYSRFVTRRVCRIYIPFVAAIFLSLVLYQIFGRHPSEHTSNWLFNEWPEKRPDLLALAGHLFMVGTAPLMHLDRVMWSLVYEMRISLKFLAVSSESLTRLGLYFNAGTDLTRAPNLA